MKNWERCLELSLLQLLLEDWVKKCMLELRTGWGEGQEGHG